MTINDYILSEKVHKNVKENFSISIFLYESICNVKLYLAVNAYQWARFSYVMLLYMVNNMRHTESELNVIEIGCQPKRQFSREIVYKVL